MFTIQTAHAETAHRPQGVTVPLSAGVVTPLGFCANISPPAPIPIQKVESHFKRKIRMLQKLEVKDRDLEDTSLLKAAEGTREAEQ